MDYLFALVNIALLIIVHEFGHFVVARMCGVHTPVFSVGFGRRLWGFDLWGTDFRLSAIPFGGYVRMAGADPFGYYEEDDELPDPSMGFMRKPLWQRVAILLAGPGANVLYALAIVTIALMVGEPKALADVGTVVSGTVAERAGFQAGDRIVEVNGHSVLTWSQFDSLVPTLGDSNTIVVERGDQRVDLTVAISEADRAERPDGEKVPFGILYERPRAMAGVDDPESPAGVAGIANGWAIDKVGEVEVDDWVEVEEAFADLGGAASVQLEMRRYDEDTDEVIPLAITLERNAWAPPQNSFASAADDWGLYPAELFVGTVEEEISDAHGFLAGCRSRPRARTSPAVKAGVQDGDHLLAIDGTPLQRWADVSRLVMDTFDKEDFSKPPRSLVLNVRRDGELLALDVQPEVVADHDPTGLNQIRAKVGIGPVTMPTGGPTTPVYYGFSSALSIAVNQLSRAALDSVERIGDLITGNAAFDQSLGGPFAMLAAGAAAAQMGLFAMAHLSAMISLSLGVVNLFPVPVLDGGQIIFYVIEGVRGRPLSAAMRERILQIAVLGMVLLMLAVTIKDLEQLASQLLDKWF